MSKQTALYPLHQEQGALLVDFAGWQMPLHYGSQLNEHLAVRQYVGVFDVSHMSIVDVQGQGAKDFLRYLLANDVAKLKQSGKALYSCLLNTDGGILDDLIVYYLEDEHYRVVVNAGTREHDFAWFKEHATPFDVQLTQRNDWSLLAVQGPQVLATVKKVFSPALYATIAALSAFQGCHLEQPEDGFIGRTGYTGEDGFEVFLPHNRAIAFWQQLMQLGVQPCGLGARDTLRLEAGLNLYGSDMNHTTTPLESNLAWTVAFDPPEREFIGKTPLVLQRQQGVSQRLVGLVLQTKGVLRAHQTVWLNGQQIGEITSGTFSPTLQQAIALARIDAAVEGTIQVMIRDKLFPATIVRPPFVKKKSV